MIRNIRILGAALGGIVGLALAVSLGGVFDRGGPYYGFFLAAWVIAWIVVGFAILPYLTIVPALWLVRSVAGPVDRRVRRPRSSACSSAC